MKSLLGAVALALAAPWLAMPTAGETPPAASAAAAEPTLTLVHQELALQPDATITITFHPSVPIGANTVRVVSFQPVTDRDTLNRAISNRRRGKIDSIDVVPVVDADGNATISVPTESDLSAPLALRLSRPGLYPLAIQVVDATGATVSEMTTFVDRLPVAGADHPGKLSIAVFASVTAPPNMSDPAEPLPADVAAAIAALVQYEPEVKLSLAISPDILGRLDPATTDTLRAVLTDGVILSQPLVPFDPSAAAAANLDDKFKQLLVDGEKAVSNTGELPPYSRTAWFASNGFTNDGLLLLRDLGLRLLVVPSRAYLQADGSNGGLTDYSQLFETQLSGADAPDTAGTSVDEGDVTCESTTVVCLPTAAVDPALAARFTDAGLSDEQAALYTAADIVVYRDFFADSLSPSNPHALVLGLDGDGVANPQRINRAVEMLGATDAATFITLDQFERNTSQTISDGRPLVLQFPQSTPMDLTKRVATLNRLVLDSTTVSSMLVENKGRTNAWNTAISDMYSTAIPDAEVDATVQAIDEELGAIKACVVPPSSYTFTLTGRSTNLPLRLTNRCDEDLWVVVHLEAAAAKIEFPPDDQLLTKLRANGPTDFPVPVVARTNGTFDVTFDVLTPTGRVRVTPTVTLRARINTLTGLPQLITGAALLILLTWWVRNMRRGRRARRVAETMSASPVPGTPMPADAVNSLDVDAPASLPDS